MKIASLLPLIALVPGALYALPMNNPAEATLLRDGIFFEGVPGNPFDSCLPAWHHCSLRAAFYGDFVFNRTLEVRRPDEGERELSKSTLNTKAALITLNFWDLVDLFATLGESSLSLRGNEALFNVGAPASGEILVQSGGGFSWSLGGRVTIWQCACTRFGLEGQYFSTRPHVSRVTRENSATVNPDHLHGHYEEWQVGLGVAQEIGLFVPYVGIKAAKARLNFHNTLLSLMAPDDTELFCVQNGREWGAVVGVSLIGYDVIAATVEGRFGDELALFVSADVRF